MKLKLNDLGIVYLMTEYAAATGERLTEETVDHLISIANNNLKHDIPEFLVPAENTITKRFKVIQFEAEHLETE